MRGAHTGVMPEVNRELADFLRRARGKVDPTRSVLPTDDRVRRVPGLRREEVAFLAGVSSDYDTRLEQGRRITPSPAVVDAIAAALGLDVAGRTHLRSLITGTPTAGPRLWQRHSAPGQVWSGSSTPWTRPLWCSDGARTCSRAIGWLAL